jgi:3-phenylpropionate/cinnamic acid dioxygenase small subunit
MTGSATGAARRNLPPAAELRELRLEIDEFNAAYAHVIDEGNLEEWPDFFTEDGLYRITARENADADLPIGLIYCDGRGMMVDRVRATLKTTSHEPRYLRHFCSNVRILGVEPDGLIRSWSNYMVTETLMEGDTRIFQCGRYEDAFVRSDGKLLLKARHCIYDTLTITNALVYPV